MSERMALTAKAVLGDELTDWQRDLLRRMPEDGRLSIDSRAAMLADRRRFFEMAALVAAAFEAP